MDNTLDSFPIKIIRLEDGDIKAFGIDVERTPEEVIIAIQELQITIWVMGKALKDMRSLTEEEHRILEVTMNRLAKREPTKPHRR